jgi:hypothetical protein
MLTGKTRRMRQWLAIGFSVGLALGLGVAIGLIAESGNFSTNSGANELPLHALATHGNDSMAIATGPMTDGMEGLVTLDFLTGELKLFVLSDRNGKFILAGRQNVFADLAVEKGKKPAFLLTMGGSSFVRGGAALQPGGSTIYVCDANTGNFMAYGIQYNATAYKAITPSEAVLVKLDAGKARDLNLGE